MKKDSWRINRQFLPIKLSYFTVFAGIAVLLPFLPMFCTKKGLTASEAAQIYGVIPFIGATLRVIVSACADRAQAHKPVLVALLVATAGIFFCLVLVPGVPRVTCHEMSAPSTATLCQSEGQGQDQGQNPESNKAVYNLCFSNNELDSWLNGNPLHSVNCSGASACGVLELSTNSSQWSTAMGSSNSSCPDDNKGDTQLSCLSDISASSLQHSDQCSLVREAELNCSLVVEKQCFQERQKYDRTFWVLLTVSILGYMAFSPTTSLMHAITYSLLGEDRNKWGKQRYFGTLGFLIAALIIGFTMQMTSQGEDTNLTWNVVSYTFLYVISAMLVCLYRVPGDIKCDSLLRNLGALVGDPVVCSLFGMVFLHGMLLGCIETFQLLYIRELGGSEFLLGLSLFMSCLLEIPALFFADAYLGRLGYVNSLYVSTFGYVLRFIVLGSLPSAWFILAANCLHSVTFGVFYTAAGAYGSVLTPPSMHGTIQGAIQALYFGFGRGMGGLISGQLVEPYGMRGMFYIFSGISAGVLCGFFLVQSLFLKRRAPRKNTREEGATEKKHATLDGAGEALNKTGNDVEPDVTAI